MDNRNERGFNVTRSSTRYTRGGISDVHNTRVGWWERTILTEDATDVFFEITARTERRPDLISNILYESPTYAWLVLQFNNIVDINTELTMGTMLKLPTPARLNTVLLVNSTGGNRVEST